MNIKPILKELQWKNLKQYEKDDRTKIIYDDINELAVYYIRESHRMRDDIREKIFEILQNKKVAKLIKRITKTLDQAPLDPSIVILFTNFMEKCKDVDEDVMIIYLDTINAILKKRIKKISKKVGLDKELVKEVLVIVPKPEIVNPRLVGIYVNRIMRKLYTLGKENDLKINEYEVLVKLFEHVFGKELIPQVSVELLLERRDIIKNFNDNQKKLWNVGTNAALEILESSKKKDIVELLTRYVKRREKDAKRNKDSARRIQIVQISKEDFPKIYKAYKKISENDKYADLL